MDWDLILSLINALGFMVIIATGLVIGLSLVEVKLKFVIKKTCYISFVYGVLYYFSQLFMSYNILLVFTYLILIPIVIYILKLSFSQAFIGVLLALTYNLIIVKLMSYNMFDIALMSISSTNDPVIQIALSTFIMLNNIFIALIFYRKSPILFPKRWLDSEHDETKKNNYHFHVVFISLILVLLNTFLFYTYTELLYFRPSYRLFVMFWCILTCILMVYFARNIVNYSIERIQMTIDKAYQKDILTYYNLIRSQRHDFNIHLNAIYGLINNGKYAECDTYIEEIIGEAKDINDLLPLRHPATAAMLSTLQLDAIQRGVTLKFHVNDDLRDMPCTIYETNKILGNLINNAIEEVERNNSNPTHVDIEITKEFNSIILRVKNQIVMSTSNLQHIFDIGFSTKTSHEGIGLPTIATIISHYNGVLFPEINEGYITMNVRIPLSQL